MTPADNTPVVRALIADDERLLRDATAWKRYAWWMSCGRRWCFWIFACRA